MCAFHCSSSPPILITITTSWQTDHSSSSLHTLPYPHLTILLYLILPYLIWPTLQAVQPGVFPLTIELADYSSIPTSLSTSNSIRPSLSLSGTHQALSLWAARTNAPARFHDFEDHMNAHVVGRSTASTSTGTAAVAARVDFWNRHLDAALVQVLWM